LRHGFPAQRQQTRNRLLIVGGAIIAVVAIVIAFVVIKANTHTSTSSSGASNGPTGTALASLVKVTTSVPESTLTQVGAGSEVSLSLESPTNPDIRPTMVPESIPG
jgi:hypothetical protein